MEATLLLRHWAWVGWGGILMFMYLAYIRGGYAACTSLGMGGVGGDINVHVPCLHTWMLRCCYVTGHGWGGGDINVHVPCLHTWMLRCCYVTGHAWGGGDMNVHVPCLHTWMLRCCYVTGHGWGGGDINVHVPCLHTYVDATLLRIFGTLGRPPAAGLMLSDEEKQKQILE